MTERPRVLIEDWLPIEELGIESRRESEIPSALPPIRFLHVWWARRPLAACSGVILASLLPGWSKDLAAAFPDEPRLSDETAYRRWMLVLCGISGDPVAAKRTIVDRKSRGMKVVEKDVYGYQRSYLNSANPANLDLLHRVLEHTWGALPNVLDPTAGGGSIPYAAARFGLPATANDINAVAAAVLRAGVEATAREGSELTTQIRHWGDILIKRCTDRLAEYFALEDESERVVGYIFARSVACPRTGKPVPLSPNWWLSKERGDEVAVRVLTERDGRVLDEPEFEIVKGDDAVSCEPDDGTVSGGDGVSIWDGLPIEDKYIKSEAQAGRLGSILYAISIRLPNPNGRRSKWIRDYRAPTATDLASLAAAEEASTKLVPTWIASRVLPDEHVPDGNDARPQHYGMTRWVDMFSPRQQLVHGVFADEFQQIVPEIEAALGETGGRDVAGVLGLMQGKALNFNALLASWHVSRQVMRSVFERHDFAFKWTYAEFEATELFPWCLEQIVDAYDGIARLYQPSTAPYIVKGETFQGRRSDLRHPVPGPVTVLHSSAAHLPDLDSGSQVLVCIDPPYYDNVMYAELSDFFGVWEQHTVGRVWPDLMPGGLADVANEAVANPARFASLGSAKRAKELANADYQAKMQAIFAECHRVLREDGVMTVMFTHKRAEAWDTLGMALMEAGFEIATSWPVNTESEQSLHQAKKNAAASTVMLVCRKRAPRSGGDTFFEDVVPEVKAAARDAVARFEADGIHGVDLLLSTYGPVLSVISSVWPVYSSEAAADGSPRLLRPEEALEVAREELVEARRRSIVGRQVTFDAVTDFWLIAWELFQAEEFPYDEARRLALAVGGQDPESLASVGILKKKAGTVVLQAPSDRRKRVLRPVQDGDFADLSLVDLLHGVLVTADLDGLAAAKTLMDRHGFTTEPRFLALVQGAVNAVPRSKVKGVFVRPEAATLDALVTAYLPTIVVPEDEAPGTLFDVD